MFQNFIELAVVSAILIVAKPDSWLFGRQVFFYIYCQNKCLNFPHLIYNALVRSGAYNILANGIVLRANSHD